jgi:hypothetical protein
MTHDLLFDFIVETWTYHVFSFQQRRRPQQRRADHAKPALVGADILK